MKSKDRELQFFSTNPHKNTYEKLHYPWPHKSQSGRVVWITRAEKRKAQGGLK